MRRVTPHDIARLDFSLLSELCPDSVRVATFGITGAPDGIGMAES